MWCSNCNRVFRNKEKNLCPICKQDTLHLERNINCPNCNIKMDIGYFSVPLRIDWRSNWQKGGKPEIIIKDNSQQSAWLRRIAYHCNKCHSFFLDKLESLQINDEKIEENVDINLLCPQCGKERVLESKFCPFCGFKFEEIKDMKISRFTVNQQSEKND